MFLRTFPLASRFRGFLCRGWYILNRSSCCLSARIIEITS